MRTLNLSTKYGLDTAYQKPASLATIENFGPGAVISNLDIAWNLPYGTDVTSLSPTYTLSAGATCDKPSGSTYDFTSPVLYTVVSEDATVTNIYTVTAYVHQLGTGKEFLSFGPGAIISGNAVSWRVPFGTDVSTLAPTYTVSQFATGDPPSGTILDFTMPQTYTVTAQDLSSNIYTVTVSVSPAPWINVNYDNVERTGLVGPAGGLGAIWNQCITNTTSPGITTNISLLNSSGGTTTAGVICSGNLQWEWDHPPQFSMLTTARTPWGSP